MKIGLDARFAIGERRGIGEYSLNLIRQLLNLDSSNQYIAFLNRPDHENILPRAENFRTLVIPSNNYFLWEQVLLPFYIRKEVLDVFHSLANTGPILQLNSIQKRTKFVCTIHDVMYLESSFQPGSVYQRLGSTYKRMIVPQVMRRYDKLVTIANFTRSEISRHAPVEGRCPVIYQGFTPLSNVSNSKLKSKDRYVLVLGAKEPRKNTIGAIRAFSLLTEKCPIRLKVVGYKGFNKSPSYQLAKDLDLLDRIDFYDYVPKQELQALYADAEVFWYLSLFEGFGIPPLEAMNAGCPVVASNRSSIPEVVGGGGLLVDPLNASDIATATLGLLKDEAQKKRLVAAGLVRAGEFSWTRTASQTLAEYQNLV